MECENFLKAITNSLSNAKSQHNIKTFGQYNLFDVLDIGSNEVLICRFLADLLDPNGKHGCGILFLKAFLEKLSIVIDNVDKAILENTRVETEYSIKADRRIDIVIYNKSFFIPIEVKIYAEEQKNQCYDYYRDICDRHGDCKLIYLTRYGTFPSEYSTAGNQEVIEHIRCISFAADIRSILENCLESINNTTIKTAVEGFLDMIKNHSDPLWKDIKDMFDKMYEDKEMFRAAVEFEKHLDSLKKRKIQIITDLMIKLETKINNSGWDYFHIDTENRREKIENQLCYYMNQAGSFYDNKKSSYPGFAYSIRKVDLDNKIIDIRFRVEIDHNLFAGICVYDIKSHEKCTINAEILPILNQYITDAKKNNSNYWASFIYLPIGTFDLTSKDENNNSNKDKVPNFKEMNETAIRLADKTELDLFVDRCIPVIKDYLDKTIVVRSSTNDIV